MNPTHVLVITCSSDNFVYWKSITIAYSLEEAEKMKREMEEPGIGVEIFPVDYSLRME